MGEYKIGKRIKSNGSYMNGLADMPIRGKKHDNLKIEDE